jgi:RNA polymerase sigma factor (sigma-70 family)
VPATAVAHRPPTAPDGVLVQEAAAGSGTSYGELYDRHAQHVYNYSLRLTGSPEDAADATQEAFLNILRRLQEDDTPVLDFSSYLFAAARNESYALMRRRSRVQVSDTPPEDRMRTADVATQPEPAVLRRDEQEAVRAANGTLPPRYREVLALRELGDRSYDEIGRIMGISENGAAQLIWRARSKMREAMTAGAVASVVATSTECERAQMLLGRIQDGEHVDELDRAWLDEHLDECGSCRSAKGMLLAVGTFYAAWVPVVAIAGLKAETLTAAGGIVGADWSGAAGGGAAAGGGGGAGASGGAVAAVGAVTAVGVAMAVLLGGGESELKRQMREQVQQPAATAPAPAAKKNPARAAAHRPGVAATAARSMRRGRPAPGQVSGFTQARPRKTTTPSRPAPRQTAPGPPGAEPAPPRDRNPRSPAPPKDEPPVDAVPSPTAGPPTPPPQARPEGSCSWPGGGGGPGGCPPGHGGIPPGHGGLAPGQVGRT